jgi:ATP-dependent helicase/nuclease subunit B
MPLALLAGPANAGKVARLLEGYLASVDREPVLVVPNRPEVERVERELLAIQRGVLGGSVGTFDDLFRRVLKRSGDGEPRQRIGEAQRSLLLARIVSRHRAASRNGLAASARFAGFAETLGDAVAELESALLEPDELEGDLGELYAAYRAELDRLGLTDRQLARVDAAALVAGDLDAWDGTPVFAYGFEDLTGAQWALLEALSGRAEVTVSLPYEPSRAVFASLERTATDLARLADDRIEELPPQAWYRADALAYVERALFTEKPGAPPPLEGAVRFLEGAGSRGALELVADEILSLLRAGKPAEGIALVLPNVERRRAAIEMVFETLGVPYALEGTVPLSRTPYGHALVGLLRFASLGGTRRDLFAFLRSPYSGLARPRADYLDGRLRGRAVTEPARVEEESAKLLGHPLPALDDLRSASTLVEGARSLARTMLRIAYGLEAPPVNERARLDLRAHEAALKLLDELEGWRAFGEEVRPDELIAALERAPVRLSGTRDPGRVAVLDLMRARTRRFDAVFVLGLEEGVFPRRALETPFLSDDLRRELEERGRRLARPDALARDRYLFYTACTRPWELLVLVRESADDEGRPREPSPFYDEVRSLFEASDVERATRRRPLASLTWDLSKAPTERERLRGVATLAAGDPEEARALARANGWERRVERALAAFSRVTKLTHPVVLRELQERERFSVTELERFHDCSSMWLFERVVSPKEIDSILDARVRGGVAHQALYRFYSGLPKRFGIETLDEEHLDEAIVFLRECLAEAIAGGVRLDVPEVTLLELEETLARDLEHFVRQDVALALPLVPRRFEVAFGTSGAPVELQRGLEVGDFSVSGKIDRIDLDPLSARGMVHDYKLGRAHSARDIEAELRLQIPLYILALRDLVGIEPLGGIYRGLTGTREARGLLRADEREDTLPGFKAGDYLEADEFWNQVDAAREHAVTAVSGMRAGDVRHNPRGGDCPQWCDLWTMCRVRRS